MAIDFSGLSLDPEEAPKIVKEEKPKKLDFDSIAMKQTGGATGSWEPKPINFKDIALKAVQHTPLGLITDPKQREGLKKAYDVASVPAKVSAEGLEELIGMIPDPQTKSTAANFVLGLPKMAADIFGEVSAGMISPEAMALGGYGKNARAIAQSRAGKAVGKKIVDLIPETIKRWTTYRYNQPELYKEIAEIRSFNLAEGTKQMLDIAKPLAKLDLATQRQAASYMKGELPGTVLKPEVKEAADAARSAFDKLSAELVELKVLSKEKFKETVGKYMPRLLSKYEKGGKALSQGASSKPTRLAMDRFKHKKDIPEELLEALGEIKEAGYPTAKGLTQMHKTVETAKMFKQVAANPEWAVATETEAIARGFKHITKNKALGELSDKYVHPEIWNDIQQITKVSTAFEKWWRGSLGAWKYGKVIANPSTHFRNLMSNSILADMGGMDQLQQLRLLPKAAKEIYKKGQYFKEARAARLLGQEFVGGELQVMQQAAGLGKGNMIDFVAKYSTTAANILNKGKQAVKGATTGLADLYQTEEQWFKLAKFIQGREQGMGIKESAAIAEKYLFNYSKVSPIVDKLRTAVAGSPFITFISKALPRVAETAMTNPVKLWKYKLLVDAMETQAQKAHNLSDEDLEAIHEQSRGSQVVLPMKDNEGRPMKLDLSYILPWGDIGEQGGFFGLPPVAPPSGPAKAVLELGMNKSMFMDKPIYNMKTDTAPEIMRKSMDHLVTSLVPSWTPGIRGEESWFKGGYSWRKFIGKLKGEKDYFGKENDMAHILAGTLFGLKLTSADPQESKYFGAINKNQQTKEVQKEFQKKLRGVARGKISKEYLLKLPDLYYKKIEKIWKDDIRRNEDKRRAAEPKPKNLMDTYNDLMKLRRKQ